MPDHERTSLPYRLVVTVRRPGWCHPIDNTTLTTWVGNFHYDGQMQNLGNCMDLPGNSNGACNIAMPAGAMPGTMCCDMFISHFHGHYCAFSPPDMDVCHVDTNFNDAVPTLATPGPTPAATNGGGATPKPTPAADSRVSTSSAQTALPTVLVVAVAMLYVIAL